MQSKVDQIWHRFNNDQANLKKDCVDIVSKCYLMLGQKPDTQQVIIMAQLLYEDLVNRYSALTLEEVKFAFEQGIRHSDSGGFVNVRSMNIWLKEYKTKANLMRSQKRLTDYQRYEENVKQIGTTINKAKRIKQ